LFAKVYSGIRAVYRMRFSGQSIRHPAFIGGLSRDENLWLCSVSPTVPFGPRVP